jgi:type IV pilus assembly protein PilM
MRILGLDPGSKIVKAVEIDSAFGRVEIHEFHEEPVNEGEETPDAALARLISRLRRRPDRIASLLPTGVTTFRNLKLPTRDRKAIQQSVTFELEDELPFEISGASWETSIIQQHGNQTELHVAATLAVRLKESIEHLEDAGADPDVLTTEAWALRTLLNKILPTAHQETPVVVVDLGRTRTVAYAHWKGRPLLVKEFNFGGDSLSSAIADRHSISLKEADQVRVQEGYILPPSIYEKSTREQQEFSDLLLQPLAPFVIGLKQFLLACRTTTHQYPSRIFICGGLSQMQGLGALLEEELELPVSPLQSLTALSQGALKYSEQTDAAFAMAAGAALTLVGAEKSIAINFRKGVHSKRSSTTDLNFSKIKKPLTYAAFIVISFFLSLVIESATYQKKLSDADVQLEKNLKSFFGQMSSSGIRNYLSRPSELKKAVERELGKQRELNRLLGKNPYSPILALRDISTAISKDTVVDMIQFRVGSAPTAPYDSKTEPDASITVLVSNPQMAEQMNQALPSRFNNLVKSQLEEIPSTDGSPKRWKVTFSGKSRPAVGMK